MENDLSKWIQLIIPILFSILTSLGIHKYLVEPRLIASQTRKKYATALWIACRELQIQLEKIKERVSEGDCGTINALKKIPNNDFGDRIDWFTKVGYYTTITAYKIAVVSSWIRLYQRDLLFSTHTKSRTFISDLYEKADKLKVAFSTNTCLWFYYFDSIGDRLIDKTENIPAPVTFSQYCDKYYTDWQFRLFFEQAHMFIWFIANGDYLKKIDEINKELNDLMLFLEKENLLTGLTIDRSPINVSELSRPLAPTNSGPQFDRQL